MRSASSLLCSSLAWCAACGALAGLAASPAEAQPASRAQEVFDRTRALAPADRAEKLAKLRSSPFVFFRGTAFLGWRDLASDPRLGRFGGVPATQTWITGDLHPENFGTFGLPGGGVSYGLNDFDEALVADYQLDLWRLATGVELAGRELGASSKARRKALERLAEAYLDALARCAGPGNQREQDPALSEGVLQGELDRFRDEVAADESRKALLKEWTRKVASQRVLDLRLDDLEPADPSELLALRQGLRGYVRRAPQAARYFQIKSVARRIQAGTGSLGSARFYVLVEGPSVDDDDDLILDLKAQPRPAGLDHLDLPTRAALAARFPSRAAQVAAAGRALLGPQRSDPYLGWAQLGVESYSVSQRSPFKGSFSLTKGALKSASQQWGSLLGYAHARSDEDADPLLIPHSLEDEVLARAGYQRASFTRLVVEIAREQADRVEADQRAFRALSAQP